MPVVRNIQQARCLVDQLDYSKPLLIEVSDADKRRSLPQNDKSHVWYNEVDKQLCLPVGTTKCECKLYFGVPILRAENEDFCQGYDRLIKNRMTKGEKLELMRWFPVTSLMTKAQKSRYMESVQHYYADQMGIVLD